MKKIGEIIVSIYLGFARVIINITKDLFWKENIYIQIQSIQSVNKRKKKSQNTGHAKGIENYMG